MTNDPNDLRYDTAGMKAYGANLIAIWKELLDGGMSRREALQVILEMVRSIAAAPKQP